MSPAIAEQVVADPQQEELPLLQTVDSSRHLVLPADKLTEILRAAEENLHWLFYHNSAEDLVRHVIVAHQEQIDHWGGFHYHCPVPIEFVGLTSTERSRINARINALLERAYEIKLSAEDGSVFVPQPTVYDDAGVIVESDVLKFFETRDGAHIFEKEPAKDVGNRELTLQVGLFYRKLDRMLAMQEAVGHFYGTRPTKAQVEHYIRKCPYWNRGDYCTCSLCTDTSRRGVSGRMTAQWREGQPLSRVMKAAYKRGKMPDQFLAQHFDPAMAAIGEIWRRQKRTLYLSICCSPAGFLALGNKSYCKGDGSCFRDNGEWEGAKHILAMLPNSCVYYFYDKEQWNDEVDPLSPQPGRPLARAWGWFSPGKLMSATNFYGLPKRELKQAMGLVAEHELGAPESKSRVTDRAAVQFSSMLSSWMYRNGDDGLWVNPNTRDEQRAIQKAVNRMLGSCSHTPSQVRYKRLERDRNFVDHSIADNPDCWVSMDEVRELIAKEKEAK